MKLAYEYFQQSFPHSNLFHKRKKKPFKNIVAKSYINPFALGTPLGG